MPASVAVRVLGEGPAVMLVHGAVAPGPTWKAQEALAARWRLVLVTRRGFRPSPAAERQDFAVDARDLEKLLRREPAHCVGFEYGALGVAQAAAEAPELVRSVTLIEPPLSEDAQPDLAGLAAGGVPALVLSGEHDPSLESAYDVLAEEIGAQRDSLPGAGQAVPRASGFNRRLERFLFGAETARPE
jgi:hypothetical protein